MTEEPLRAFALRGSARAEALEFLHVHADVRGVLEVGNELVVYLPHELPALPMDVEVEERPVSAADFAHTGLENDRSIQVTDDLLVRPPWVDRPAGFDGIELVVPRGGAFGSGEDHSTQASLRALHATWSQPASVADVGCGSGILALYAHVRGCPSICGCDIDEPSVLAARELLPTVDFRLGPASTLPAADLVIANMTGDELQQALPELLAGWTRRSELILGGTREHQVDALAARVPGAIVHQQREGEFVASVFQAR